MSRQLPKPPGKPFGLINAPENQMPSSEREDSCTITWNPPSLTLDELAEFTSMIAELHDKVAVPYVTGELYRNRPDAASPKPPLVASISMGSPLVTQLLAGEGGVASLGMVGLILKNPGRLGEFLPQIRASWHEGSMRALEAKLHRIQARDIIEAHGRPIEAFERDYRAAKERAATDRIRDDLDRERERDER
jgi:hypothetical protein